MSVEFPSTDWHYYTVSGSTLQEVAALIEREAEAGKAEWFPRIDYQTDEHGRLSDVSITVPTRVTLPDWSEYNSARPAEQHEWDRFRYALTTHENGHVDLVQTHLAGVDSRLMGEAKDHGLALYQQALDALNSASRAYDSQTNHGRNDGTIIDISVCP
jgi:predicted secreted Zn-dependent protease